MEEERNSRSVVCIEKVVSNNKAVVGMKLDTCEGVIRCEWPYVSND